MLRCVVIGRQENWKESLPIKSDLLGTVKYNGDFPLENWTNVWGIEWDSSLKGKNSGYFNKQKFFDCIEGRGSFIKDGGSLMVITETDGLEFEEAWNLRYEIRVNNKGENINGIEWAQNIKENALKEVNLSGYNISKLNDVSKFVQVEKLNISFNLFSEWGEDMRKGLLQMKLRWLNLSGNRFLNVKENGSDTFEIETLILARCLFKHTENWHIIVNWFTNVKKLDLGFNEFNDENFEGISLLRTIETIEYLELNNNEFTQLKFVSDQWSSLRILELSNSPIVKLVINLPKLESLDISNTKIGLTFDDLKSWVSLMLAPNLSSLKLFTSECIDSLDYTTNKLQLSTKEEPINYDIVLGMLSLKFPNLTKVNGTQYTNSQLEEYKGVYSRYTATLADRTGANVEDPNYTKITVNIPIEGILTQKNLRVRKGTPWYVIHGVICRQFGLKAGHFVIETNTT